VIEQTTDAMVVISKMLGFIWKRQELSLNNAGNTLQGLLKLTELANLIATKRKTLSRDTNAKLGQES
jgi:hypothetical protein